MERREGDIPLPEAFLRRMRQLLGEEFLDFISSYDEKPVCSLRLNPLKKGEMDVRAILNEIKIDEPQPVKWAKNGWYYEESPIEEEGGCRPGRHPYHEMGLYYIQEASAMAPAALLGARPGERVLDLCAAPGGKSTQIAADMEQQGLLVCNEINPARAKILSGNIERMGIANALVLNEDSGKLRERFPGFFYRILVDAPCSGEGMFRKHPESRQEWSPGQVQICARRQKEILDNAAEMLMPGGRLVYSTCTFAPEEDERVVDDFLNRHPDFRLMEPAELPTAEGYPVPGRPDWVEPDCDFAYSEEGKPNLSGAAPEEEMRNSSEADQKEGKPNVSGAVPKRIAGGEKLSRTRRLWPHRLRGEGHFVAVLEKEGRLPEPVCEPGAKAAGQRRSLETVGLPGDSMKSKEAARTAGQRRSLETAGLPGGSRGGKKAAKVARQRTLRKKKGKNPAEKGLDEKQRTLVEEFAESALASAGAEVIEDPERLLLFGDQLYRLPELTPPLAGLSVLRPGLHLGTFKKERFEPAHALALFLGRKQVRYYAELGMEEMKRYLRGESLSGAELKGWILAGMNGFSAGWVKGAGGMLKNHYPKGLRG